MISAVRFSAAGIALCVMVFFAGSVAAGSTVVGTNYIVYSDDFPSWTWADAESYAQNTYGSHLASIHSSADLAEIVQLIDEAGVGGLDRVWIGGYESPPNSEIFFNLDGTPWDFEVWALGDPDFGEDCVGLSPVFFDEMSDFLCNDSFSAMVINRPNFAPGRAATNSPLVVSHNPGVPGNLDFSWGAACGANASHYGLYEGTLGDFAGHVSMLCGLTGTTATNQAPLPDNTYYLVVPYSFADSEEGSYGAGASGAERPRGSNPCQPSQDLAECE